MTLIHFSYSVENMLPSTWGSLGKNKTEKPWYMVVFKDTHTHTYVCVVWWKQKVERILVEFYSHLIYQLFGFKNFLRIKRKKPSLYVCFINCRPSDILLSFVLMRLIWQSKTPYPWEIIRFSTIISFYSKSIQEILLTVFFSISEVLLHFQIAAERRLWKLR